MTSAETRAIVTVSLLAAFVDGEKHERERAGIKRIAEGLAQAEGVHLPTLYQDVLMKRVTLAGVLPALASVEAAHAAAPFLATAVAPAFDQHHEGPLMRSA
jgi:DnaJ-domain-containing protein 1